MKHLLFLLALIPAVLFSQTVDFSLTDETNLGISLSEIKFVVDGDVVHTPFDTPRLLPRQRYPAMR